MTSARGRFLRDNAFLIGAIALPIVVAGFFILATAIPRWTVPPPAHDLVLRAARPYDATPASVSVEFNVRNGRVEAVARRAQPNTYPQRWGLLHLDHRTMKVREIAFELPDNLSADEVRTIAIPALADLTVSPDAKAPDGYELQTSTSRGPGLVGDLFGMHRYRENISLVNRGRVIRIALPSPYENPYANMVYSIGWVVSGQQ